MTPTQKKLFGTDGVRGVAGELLTAELALALGRAAAGGCDATRPQVLIVRDTRESGPMLESALAAGVCEAGGDALLAGVLPTPAASILVRRLGLDLAAVISASHNPWRDNGIKFFGRDGRKLADEAEAAIEARLADGDAGGGGGEPIGRARTLEGALDDYLRELEHALALDLSGTRVVLDCANGATHRAAPAIFRRLGAEVELIGDEPDGRNINEGCGSTAPGGGRVRGGRRRGDDRLRLRRGRRPGHRRRRARRGARRRRADRAAWPRTCGRPAGSTASRSR